MANLWDKEEFDFNLNGDGDLEQIIQAKTGNFEKPQLDDVKLLNRFEREAEAGIRMIQAKTRAIFAEEDYDGRQY